MPHTSRSLDLSGVSATLEQLQKLSCFVTLLNEYSFSQELFSGWCSGMLCDIQYN